MTTNIHPDALCAPESVGLNTEIGALSIVEQGATLGSNCRIGSHVSVQAEATIGNNVTLDSGVRVGSRTVIGDRVSVGCGAAIGFGSHAVDEIGDSTTIENGALIGSGSVVVAGLRVGRNSVVGTGSIVTTDVPPNAMVAGNPARVHGYVHAMDQEQRLPAPPAERETGNPILLGVGGCELWNLPQNRDARGSLVSVEFARELPFVPVRTFFVFDVPGEDVRGEHAHRHCSQFLIASSGGISVVIDDGSTATEVRLDRPNLGLYIPPGVWGIQYRFHQGGVLTVFASAAYDPDDYIRDYDEFTAYVRTARPS